MCASFDMLYHKGQKRDLISERRFILKSYILTSTQENGRKMCYFFVPILNRNKEVKSVVRAKKVKSSDIITS